MATANDPSTTHEYTDRFARFLTNYYHDDLAELAQRYPKDDRSLVVEYDDLYQFDDDLAMDVRENPDQTLKYAETALSHVELPIDVSWTRAHVRVNDLGEFWTVTPGGFSPTERVGELLTVEGQVAKVTDVYSKLVVATWECQRCGVLTDIRQDGDDLSEPHECPACERQGPFEINQRESELIDGQKIRLEEPPEQTAGANGSHCDVFLEDDLVGAVQPGDRAAITGVVRLEGAGNQQSLENKFHPYIDGQAVELQDTQFEDIEIDDEDEERIKELADPDGEETIFDLAIGSIAPGIAGAEYDPIKESIFLQLVSGAQDGATRGDIHILLVGDPSTGKSELQEAAAEIAPRSVTASGKGASKAGMTASAVRDTGFSDAAEWTLEAGAIVKASGGIACLDELDKMDSDVTSSIHRAMEQQEVAVNKAGINATLPARTSVLAAANPVSGRWDRYDDGAPIDQVDLAPPLLSRFGLKWITRDEPDDARDREIARTMLERQEAAKAAHRHDMDADEWADPDIQPTIPPEMLRKYIAYARREVQDPSFPEEVRTEISESFADLRMAAGDDATVPVTTRTVEDVRRLAEAAARAELCETVADRHVTRARELIGESLQQFGVDEDGHLDADTVETGATHKTNQTTAQVKAIIADLSDIEEGAQYDDVLDAAGAEGFDDDEVRDAISRLKNEGKVYEPIDGMLRTT